MTIFMGFSSVCWTFSRKQQYHWSSLFLIQGHAFSLAIICHHLFVAHIFRNRSRVWHYCFAACDLKKNKKKTEQTNMHLLDGAVESPVRALLLKTTDFWTDSGDQVFVHSDDSGTNFYQYKHSINLMLYDGVATCIILSSKQKLFFS